MASSRLTALPDPDQRAAALDLLADGVMSIAGAVRFAGVSRTTLYGAMDAGHLAFVKRGRRRLIPRRALVAWLAEGLVID